MSTKFTPKKKVFADEYLKDLNGTQAAIRAGYSEKTANEQAARLLADVSVKEYIQQKMKKREERTEITADMVLKELARIGFADLRKLASWSPGGVMVRSSEELSDDEVAIVSEISQTETEHGTTVKVKMHDKIKALDKIGQHLGMWTNKLELSCELQVPGLFINVNGDKVS